MTTNRNNWVFPMIIISALFIILGFAVGVNAYFVPFVKEAFKISTAKSYMVMTATYSAYILFGVPSGFILKRVGYKGGMAVAFLIIACGFFLITPAGKTESFSLFLLALFVNGMGQTLLTGSVSTYVAILGPEESAAKRMSIMGIFHKTSFAGASFILAGFLDLMNARIEDVVIPFYIISGILLIVGILTYLSPIPEIKDEVPDEENEHPVEEITKKYGKNIFQYPHLFLGFIAMFFYMGAEVIALGSINDYAAFKNLPSPANYVWFTSAGMVLGYIIGALFIPKYFSQRTALIWCTYLGIITAILIYLVPGNLNIYLVAVLGLANSLMYPAIWPLAISDLGKFTKTGTSILVMGIIGAAVIPLLFGYVVDLSSYRIAYLICLPSYLFILYYAISGSKIRRQFS
ncbi:MFS transporter [Bacteroidota bacterium]